MERRLLYPTKCPLIGEAILSTTGNVLAIGKLIPLSGKEGKGAILTATERRTGFLLMKKLKCGKNAKSLARELFLMMLPYKNFVHSITSDNGSEFYEHKRMAGDLAAEYYFAHPYSSWRERINSITMDFQSIVIEFVALVS
jgi:IS30 family transposase